MAESIQNQLPGFSFEVDRIGFQRKVEKYAFLNDIIDSNADKERLPHDTTDRTIPPDPSHPALADMKGRIKENKNYVPTVDFEQPRNCLQTVRIETSSFCQLKRNCETSNGEEEKEEFLLHKDGKEKARRDNKKEIHFKCFMCSAECLNLIFIRFLHAHTHSISVGNQWDVYFTTISFIPSSRGCFRNTSIYSGFFRISTRNLFYKDLDFSFYT